jgi:hypothetical protein
MTDENNNHLINRQKHLTERRVTTAGRKTDICEGNRCNRCLLQVQSTGSSAIQYTDTLIRYQRSSDSLPCHRTNWRSLIRHSSYGGARGECALRGATGATGANGARCRIVCRNGFLLHSNSFSGFFRFHRWLAFSARAIIE